MPDEQLKDDKGATERANAASDAAHNSIKANPYLARLHEEASEAHTLAFGVHRELAVLSPNCGHQSKAREHAGEAKHHAAMAAALKR